MVYTVKDLAGTRREKPLRWQGIDGALERSYEVGRGTRIFGVSIVVRPIQSWTQACRL
jgi:hypothetical protein